MTHPDNQTHPGTAPPAGPATPTARGFWHGRSGIVIAVVLAAFSTYLLVGIFDMDVPSGAAFPGPTFFPALIVAAGYLLSVLLAVFTIKNPDPPKPPHYEFEEDLDPDVRAAAEKAAARKYATYSDWSSVVVAISSFLLFALLMEPLGWIIAAAVLFWGMARAMGSRRPLFDISLALVVASLIQLAFGAALGLNLPAGILGGVF